MGHAQTPSKFIEDEDDLTMLTEALKYVLTSGEEMNTISANRRIPENRHFNNFMNALKAENDPKSMNRRVHQL